MSRTRRFLLNVLWNWMGAAVALFAGLILSPFMIRRLGEEGYGIWALVFALIVYYDILDFGFRSAVVKYTAHYRALDQPERVNTVINTALLYFSLIGGVVLVVTLLVFRSLHGLFHISAAYRPQFATLILLVGFSWALGAVCHSFSASLEAYQRFDLFSRARIAYVTVRSLGCGLLLLLGYGLVPLGIMVVSSQVLQYWLTYRNFRQTVPGYRFNLGEARFPVFRQLLGYGRHTFVANSSWQVVTQAPAVLIGHFLPAEFVGYFAVSSRLIEVSIDVTEQVIAVSTSNTAELAAHGEMGSIARLGVLINRYCLTAFLPIGVILWTYRAEVIHAWIRKAIYVSESAPLVPLFVLGAVFALVGQSNAPSILYGLGMHRGYARGLLVEACASIASLFYVIPRYGIWGAAAVAVTLMILDRGLYTPWYLCRALRVSYVRYMTGVYSRPLLTAIPLVALIYAVKATILPGRNLLEIAAASGLAGVVGWGLGFLTSLEPDHRALFRDLLTARAGRIAGLFRREPATEPQP
jgi:O-antigen/teichoic acid export membrane protein